MPIDKKKLPEDECEFILDTMLAEQPLTDDDSLIFWLWGKIYQLFISVMRYSQNAFLVGLFLLPNQWTQFK